MNPKLIPLIIAPALLGWFFLKLALRKSSLPLKNLFSAVMAPAAGFTLISLTVFISTVIIPRQARLISVLAPWIYILIFMLLFVFSKKQTRTIQSGSKSPIPLLVLQGVMLSLLTLAFLNFVNTLAVSMTWNPFGGWDARFFWHLKARLYVRDPEQWRVLFSEYFRWGNNDYPLMVPGVIAWGWHFLGRESLIWPMMVSGIFVGTLGALVIWHLAAWRSWSTASIAGMFFFTMPAYLFWGGTMYCDIPYAVFSNTALLLLINALRLRNHRILALSAFFAGCSAFTKNEGLFFLLWYGLMTAGALLYEYRESRKELFKALAAAASGLLVPLLICLYFKIAFTGGQNVLVSKRDPASIFAALTNGPRNRVILEGFKMYFADPKNWNGLWFLFAGAAVYWHIARKSSTMRYSGLLLLAVVLINLGYAFILTITPHSIYKHIETSLMRLILQTGALALVFIFETFGFERKS